MELGQSLGLLLDGVLLERRLKSLGERSDRIVQTCTPPSVRLTSKERTRRTLSDGGGSDLGQLDEHEVAKLLDFLLVRQTEENAAKVLVDLNLLEARVEQRVHALVRSL